MAELKSRPFCGGAATQFYSAVSDTYIYGCFTSCCMGNAQNHFFRFETDKEAIEAWNRRAGETK